MKKVSIVLCIIACMVHFDSMCINFKKAFKQAKKTATKAGNVANNTVAGIQDLGSQVATGTKDAGKDALAVVDGAIAVISDPMAAVKELIRKEYPVQQKFTDDQLQVRQGQGLCPRELKFLENRMPKAIQALKKYFDIDTPLKIGLCFSGGGNRAMLVSLGFLLEAEAIGLFDSALYIAGLSGSTWTITPFSYLHATQGMSLQGFRDQLIVRMGSIMKEVVKGAPPIPVFTAEQNKSMQNTFAKRFAYDQYVSSIDMYGVFIGDFSLLPAGANRLDVTWSSIADQIEQGKIPLPMGSAIADKPTGKDDYYWFEVGPFEVGSDQVNSYVPVQSFGAKYKNGKVVSGYAGHTPEYPLSFYEGVFGSAFTASMNEMDRLPLKKYSIKLFGKDISLSFADAFVALDDNAWFSNKIVDNIRLFPACFHNYTFDLPDSPIRQESKLKLYDGGLNFDLPLPLVMRPARDLDFIVACDAMIDLNTLQLAAVHFKRNNIKFPDVSKYTEATISKPLTVLNDPRKADYDKDMVTIAYCPFIKNDGFSKTFDPAECRANGFCKMLNFNYTKEQAEQVIGVTRYNLQSVKDEIKAVLKALEKQKRVQENQNHVPKL